MSIRVVHFKKSKYDIYIGRPSKWGNPFTIQEFVPEKESYQRRIEELEAELRTQKDECDRFHKPA